MVRGSSKWQIRYHGYSSYTDECFQFSYFGWHIEYILYRKQRTVCRLRSFLTRMSRRLDYCTLTLVPHRQTDTLFQAGQAYASNCRFPSHRTLSRDSNACFHPKNMYQGTVGFSSHLSGHPTIEGETFTLTTKFERRLPTSTHTLGVKPG